MKCHRCDDTELQPTKLAPGLPALCCSTCQGLLIELLSYRIWRDGRKSSGAPESVLADLSTVQEGRNALSCQTCSRIMLRYRISEAHVNYIDVCTSCDRAWLDGGEWDLLAHLDAQNKLTRIMTVPWQSRLRKDAMTKMSQQMLIDEIGADGAQRLEEFVQWYESLDLNEAAARYLREHNIP